MLQIFMNKIALNIKTEDVGNDKTTSRRYMAGLKLRPSRP